MLLLSFGLLAIAPLFSGSVKTGASSNQLASSNTLAREKLEEVIGYPATDARLCGSRRNERGRADRIDDHGQRSVVGHNTSCDNDLPNWYNPSTGAISAAAASPGEGWYRLSLPAHLHDRAVRCAT